jgi:uncharacterized membrane protein (UPF0182 family)
MRRILLLGLAFALVIVLVAGLPALANLAADWYWFQAVGFEVVFIKQLVWQSLIGLGVGAIAFVFLFVNLRTALRGVVPDPLILHLRSRRPTVDPEKLLRHLAWPVALIIAFLVGAGASGAWLPLLRFFERTSFGSVDPVFGRDIGYYVFTLPVVSMVLGFVTGMVTLALLLTVPLYLMRRDLVLVRRRVTIEPAAQLHLALLVASLFLVTGLRVFFVELPSLLYSATGPMLGASYTDLAVRIPVLKVAGVAALLGAAFVLWGVRTRRLVRHVAVSAVLYFGVLLVGSLAGSAVQRLIVIPNELVKEAPQLQYHIDATRQAWALDRVTVRDLSGESRLTLEDVEANTATIENVRLWDRDPLLQTFGQLQEIRTYYDFVSVDDDRYMIDGKYRQVLLSPRELNSASLPTRTFINEHLTFTHGMGLTLGPVNRVTQEGLPVLFIRDLPPVSDVSITVTRPGIYYGELSNEWVFVKTSQDEFDYPSGDGNVFATYEGEGGVPVSSLLRRLLISAHFGSLKILMSQDITRESRVMYHRRIGERARKALPFLYWDGDPYMVITEDGHLKWILDAYTASNRYPYAQRLPDGTNYLRNSVKVVIDAYDGTIDAYISDAEDPLIRTYEKIFAGVFKPLDAMPADLRAHIRYPQDLFRAQTLLWATYHMGEPEIFYHREDEWQIPATTRGDASRDPFLRHVVMTLPGEGQEEFILMVPFTPRQKDNLSAWMVARNDGEHYGELVVYRFPRQRLVFGPTQVVNRINQDTEVSRQVSLWDQRGSEVIRGNLLVIPIEESLIFVQALYLRAEGGRIPELKRVIVAYENHVVMEETLEAGLARLFGGLLSAEEQASELTAATTAAPQPTSTSVGQLAREASDAYQRAIAAQQTGDWARYGQEMRRVGELLTQLRETTGGGN